VGYASDCSIVGGQACAGRAYDPTLGLDWTGWRFGSPNLQPAHKVLCRSPLPVIIGRSKDRMVHIPVRFLESSSRALPSRGKASADVPLEAWGDKNGTATPMDVTPSFSLRLDAWYLSKLHKNRRPSRNFNCDSIPGTFQAVFRRSLVHECPRSPALHGVKTTANGQRRRTERRMLFVKCANISRSLLWPSPGTQGKSACVIAAAFMIRRIAGSGQTVSSPFGGRRQPSQGRAPPQSPSPLEPHDPAAR